MNPIPSQDVAADSLPGLTPPTREDALPLMAKEFARPSAVRAFAEMGLTWAVIAAIEAAYLAYPAPWVFLIAFAVVASRQYALLILMHDAFHSLFHPNRHVNDLAGVWLLGAPCGSSFWGSRASHLEHHRKLGVEADPDLFLYSAGPPREKRTLAAFTKHFAFLMLGEQLLYTHFGGAKGQPGSLGRKLRNVAPRLIPVAIAQLAILGVFAAAGSWTVYFTLWVLPLLTLAVLFNGIRAFCDHANPSDQPGDEVHRLVSYISNPIERFFLAPYHMNFHAEHHLFPYVPHYHLPRVRQKLQTSREYNAAIQWREGYLRFVREFLQAPEA